MDTNQVAILAGSISTMIFAASNIPMLVKVLRTKDIHSYSATNIVLANVGNLIYWVYLLTLPFGPVWLLHGYNTITTGLMLALYLRFGHKRAPQRKIRGRNEAIFQTQEMPAV
jgi:uncharacterized protein with PQ loop repeat